MFTHGFNTADVKGHDKITVLGSDIAKLELKKLEYLEAELIQFRIGSLSKRQAKLISAIDIIYTLSTK